MPTNLPPRRPRVPRPLGFLVLAVAIAVIGRYFESNRHNGHAPNKPDRTSARVDYGMPATVIDGDSLRLGHSPIRLDGIDAPELRQSCRNALGHEWPCGRAAKARLAALVSGHNVVCTEQGRDRYGRALASSADNVRDLGEAMVREGYALNYGRYTDRYLAAQSSASAARRGIWRGPFERPEAWRSNNRRQSVGWSGR